MKRLYQKIINESTKGKKEGYCDAAYIGPSYPVQAIMKAEVDKIAKIIAPSFEASIGRLWDTLEQFGLYQSISTHTKEGIHKVKVISKEHDTNVFQCPFSNSSSWYRNN